MDHVALYRQLLTLEVFGTYSGLRMNTEKTQIVWIGKKRGSKEKLNITEKLSWGATDFKLLGIQMSVNINSIVNVNYDHEIESLSNRLEHWKKQYLTPYGKIAVIKTFIFSKFIHLITSIPSPSDIMLRKLNSILFKFIWDGKPDKIKRCVITSNLEQGGLKMINLSTFISSLKLSWIKRFLEPEDS